MSERSLALPLVVLGLAVAAVTSVGIGAHATYGARVTADEPQYLLTAISLGSDGDLDIANQLEDEAYRRFHRVDLDPQTYVLDDRGRQISPHDPLLPLLLALPMRAGGWVAAKATLAVMAGVLAALTAWTAVRRFGVRTWVAIGTIAAFALTAPLATYATQVYPEIPAALAVMVAVAALTGQRRAGGLVAATAAIVALPWLSVKYAPIAAMLAGLALVLLRGERRRLVAVVVALTLSAIVYAIGHRLIYGGWTAYATGDYFANNGGESTVIGAAPNYLGRARRLGGLLVDDPFGLVLWMPAWLLAPFALGFVTRRRPAGWSLLVFPAAVGWLVATFVAATMHGWWWPGRQVVVVAPLLAVCVALAADAIAWVRVALAAAAAVGIATWWWTTVDAIRRAHVLVVDFDRTGNPFVRVWRLLLPDGMTATTADHVLVTAWSLLIVVSIAWGWHSGLAPSSRDLNRPTSSL